MLYVEHCNFHMGLIQISDFGLGFYENRLMVLSGLKDVFLLPSPTKVSGMSLDLQLICN